MKILNLVYFHIFGSNFARSLGPASMLPIMSKLLRKANIFERLKVPYKSGNILVFQIFKKNLYPTLANRTWLEKKNQNLNVIFFLNSRFCYFSHQENECFRVFAVTRLKNRYF